MEIKKGDWVNTPRFLKVKIEEVFETEVEAWENGYREPTHYEGGYKVLGKRINEWNMIFAAVKKGE